MHRVVLAGVAESPLLENEVVSISLDDFERPHVGRRQAASSFVSDPNMRARIDAGQLECWVTLSVLDSVVGPENLELGDVGSGDLVINRLARLVFEEING